MPLVSLRDVSLAFGGPRLLDRADWQIERGERVCLLGRNGEGKSTLLRLVEGHAGEDRGHAVVVGVVLIGGFRQSLGHHVRDGQTAFLGDLLGQPRDPQPLLADHLALVRLEAALDQPEQRALALAVAAQQADAFAPLDLPVDAIQQPGSAEGQADVSEAQERHE